MEAQATTPFDQRWIETHVPARLDRLPFSRWHWLVVIALGVTWILDGLEVTLAGALAATLKNPVALGLTDTEVGATATAYLTGAVIGALFFGYLTDRLGRKRLFFITLGVYLTATALSGVAWNFWSFALFRAITGAGIGGEYAAINSAIDELIPARLRGQVDLAINATYWIGAALGSVLTIYFLDPHFFPAWLGWRLVFGVGAALGLVILIFRYWVPESPRWLMVHGHPEDAEKIVGEIEKTVAAHAGPLPKPEGDVTRLRVRHHTPWHEIWHTVVHAHRRRSILGFVLMASQAFFYNAILFSYALVLTKFYDAPPEGVGSYLLPIALGNAVGPILIGRLFDIVGRKPMIVATYALSGALLVVCGWCFQAGLLTLHGQVVFWSVIFFIASAAASSAYLTVSEIFPLEIRGMAISIFYSVGTLVGGVAAPTLFGHLIGTGSRTALFAGYAAGGILMILGAVAEAWLGVKAERQSLENIARPLSAG
ncbi:major facilitator superfamily MFS_1 [Chthoniobacter flavus Ellin428]|uniref:Major facilitator superfamily MFS_1 n=1 Tax=Chthoniobacter flavus Ellin428 TaxID=497964 RepID=B4CWD2_9BACT|nr:MFS transporter [Chthoniobacter flavus]EDY21724.1 major facilitator superfamily MFS_1 [Chthoniobacter flavus Ellin428]TCO95659.1 putative MFS family arabinose efflux permease [Chthoniobacter flavus]